jgi:peptide/nickel transport system substrate-binding protein
VPPRGGNRGHYTNARVDGLLAEAADAGDEDLRRAKYVEVQKMLAEDLPAIPLWYPRNEVVHTRRVEGIVPQADGSFGFLRGAWLR